MIAGDGVAASGLACCLLGAGFGVVLLGGRRRSPVAVPVIEALPEATARLFGEVGLGRAVGESGAVAVDGFDNRYGSG